MAAIGDKIYRADGTLLATVKRMPGRFPPYAMIDAFEWEDGCKPDPSDKINPEICAWLGKVFDGKP